MRKTLLALLAAIGAAACTTPCQELGHRTCDCVPSGTLRNTCQDAIDRQLKDAGGGSSAVCDCLLGTCAAPPGTNFCDWIQSQEGKEACGLAYPTGDPTTKPATCYPQ
jgi:hypothetical protein